MAEAVAEVKDLLEKDDLSAEDSLRLFRAALTDADCADALQALLAAAEDGKRGKARTAAKVRRALAHWALGRTRQALEELEGVEPSEARAFVLGRCAAEIGDYALARKAYEDGIKVVGDSILLLAGAADAALELGEIDATKKRLAQIEKLRGPNDVEGHFLRGRMAEQEGDHDKAEEHYERVIVIDPDHSSALFRLGYHYALRADDEKAIECYERCRELEPVTINALLNLGCLYEDHDQYDEAIDCYEQVLKVVPNHARARLYLKDAEASLKMYYDEDLERRADRRSQILKVPVTDFELSVRSRNCLNKMNIRNLGDLIQKTEEELLAYKNFGETSLMEIKQMLAQKGLRLGMGRPDEAVLDEVVEPAQAVSEELMQKPLGDLDLSVRSRKCMERLEINTIGDLLRKTEAELLAAKNFGATSLSEIKQKLAELGLRLKGAEF